VLGQISDTATAISEDHIGVVIGMKKPEKGKRGLVKHSARQYRADTGGLRPDFRNYAPTRGVIHGALLKLPEALRHRAAKAPAPPPTPDSAKSPWMVVSGLDGSGKTTLATGLARKLGARFFRIPFHDFVKPGITRSGNGDAFADVHTDRLLFAADARLTNYLIRDWRAQGIPLVSQRAWMDSYVFSSVQGVSYEETAELLRPEDLERPSAIVYLVAKPEVAYERIRNDPHGDKYETLPFMRVQYKETVDFCEAVRARRPLLALFHDIPALLIDTTHLTTGQVFERAAEFIDSLDLAVTPSMESLSVAR
jgi:thymidylate kinase